METKYYTVARIDGDYAWLKRTDKEEELLLVARALRRRRLTMERF